MKITSILIAVAFILICFSVNATELPETIIEMSVFNLVKRSSKEKKQREPRLPPNFAKIVAALIRTESETLLNCLKQERVGAVSLSVDIFISMNGNGKAIVLNRSEDTAFEADCVVQVLSKLRYPQHTLSKEVKIKLPIKLEKEAL